MIEAEAAGIAPASLAKAAAALGKSYSASGRLPVFDEAAARAAYLVARMRAIYQVNELVLGELARLRPELDVVSALDIGCGPATATLAARAIFDRLERVMLIDRDAAWFDTGRRLIASIDEKLAVRFEAADLQRPPVLAEHDLVMISYALGEMPETAARALVRSTWNTTRCAILIVEPGTPRGFATAIAVREELIEAGATIVAPCTHSHRCPIRERDWCHFDTRVERTPLHQRLKSGSLPYEIEKYSYIIATKAAASAQTAMSRIIRHPLKRSGHVILDLCTGAGSLERIVVSRRDREAYRKARGAKWGDLWKL